MPSVCFVCLGNICRSPMAAAVAAHLIAARPDAATWTVASCGTGAWHVGEDADPRTLAVLRRAGIPLRHRARQLATADYQRFDWLLAMDGDNLAVLEERRPAAARARIGLLGAFDPEASGDIADPYYGGDAGFDRILDQIHRACRGFLVTIPAP